MNNTKLCTTCLSAHRRLAPLSSLQYISKILLDLGIETDTVCWECRAYMMKFQIFMQKALKAQNLLKQHRKEKQLDSLSCLHYSTKTNDGETIVYTVKSETKCNKLTNNVIKPASKNDVPGSSDCTKTEKYDDDSLHDEDFYLIEIDVANEVNLKLEKEEDTQINELKRPNKKSLVKKKKKLKKNDLTEIESNFKISKDEEKFIIKKMTLEEVYKMRELDKEGSRYKSCPYKCVNCITGYFNEDKYEAHIKLKHLEKIGNYKCKICAVRFKRKDALQYHFDCHFRRYHCSECPHNSHRLSAMLIHNTEQHTLGKYDCTVCGEGFLKSRQLRYHVEKTHKERPKCQFCGKTYVNTSILKKHMALMHGSEGSGVCTDCGGTYRQLAAHKRTHLPAATDAYCAPCGTSFRSRTTYRRHLRAHTTHLPQHLRRYECAHCSRRFTSKTNLQRHVGSKHTNQYPFTCDACGKGFSRRDRLKYHIQEKHEDKPRPKDKICNFCGKGFKDQQVLRNHIRVHTGERPYRCRCCPAAFAQRAALVTHTRALHPTSTAPSIPAHDSPK